MENVRVRFAPSPTGALHIGGVRTALYNYLFARQNKGKFILRIEDTDQKRFVMGAEEYIRESLEWLGISPDEDPWNGGPKGPYRQSERKVQYMDYAMKMVEEGTAYYAFDTPEELEEMREKYTKARMVSPQYNSITRSSMKNSLTLDPSEVKERLDSGQPYVIRVKIPQKEEVRFEDMIRGWIMVHSSELDDKVIMKSDGMPTYHLANVVDDFLMGISHVIRGEEWLPSAPLHVLLYRYLGFEEFMPKFAHLPLLLKPDGNGKLSKRDAEKHGFTIFPLLWVAGGENLNGFKEEGYLPEALINFLSLLGWNPGTEEELFSLDDLVNRFSIDRIGKSGAKFDIEKAKWFNQHYIRQKSNAELTAELKSVLEAQNVSWDESKADKIVELMKERITFFSEFWTKGKFLFQAPTEFDEKTARKKWNASVIQVLDQFNEKVQNLSDFNAETIHEAFVNTLEELETSFGKVMQGVRLAISGQPSGPDLMKVIEILGKEELTFRIKNAYTYLEPYLGDDETQ